jgi:HEAT repeat protein
VSIVFVAYVLSAGHTASLARAEQPSDAINQYLAGFDSAGWEGRSSAFYDLLKLGSGDRSYVAGPVRDIVERASPAEAEMLKLALIKLLDKENEVVEGYKRTGLHFGEEYSNYYGDLIAAVTTLKDPRSMNALLGAITTGGMVEQTLAAFAPTSLSPVLERCKEKDPETRVAAIFVLTDMLEPQNYQRVKPYRLTVKRTLLEALKDPLPAVRSAAVSALAVLGDTDVIPVVRDLAEHDPAYLPEKADTGGYLYLVRPEAKKALAELLAKQKVENAR